MIRHIVMFRLDGADSERRRLAEAFASALRTLPARIPELLAIEAGVNVNPAEKFDVALAATCASLDTLAAYSAHPAHLEAVAIIKPFIAERACADIEVS